LEVILRFISLGYDVELTFLFQKGENIWIGIIIDTDIRCIDAVACFGKNKIFSYFSYGSESIAYNTTVYWSVLKSINKNKLLEELCPDINLS